MKRNIITIVLLLFSQFLMAQILTFEFDALNGDEETAGSNTNNANIESSVISRGDGLTATANTHRFNAKNWGENDIATAVSNDDYMEFTITPNTGYEFSVDSIYLQLRRSSKGPRGIAIRSSLDNFATNLDQEYAIDDVATQQIFTFTFNQSSNLPVVYRIYMWAEANAGSGGIGDKAGNDLVIYGSVSHITSAKQIIIMRNCDPKNNAAPDRYAEIYNAGDQSVDITNWTLHNIQNGNDKFHWTFSGSIAPGETWVCARADATNQTITPDVTAVWKGAWWNGNGGDGTVLKNSSGVIMDSAVQVGNTNKFSDKQMKRKQTILVSNTSFDPDEWDYFPVADANDFLPGVHGTVWRNRGEGVKWELYINWDNGIPTKYVDVYIMAGSYQPRIKDKPAAECKDLHIPASASVTINARRALTVYGTLTNDAGNSGLILKAASYGVASLLHHTDGVAATVETYFDLDAHYFISAPISNAQSDVFMGQYMYSWNEPNYSWDNFSETDVALTPAKGYDVWNVDQNTVTYEGTLNNGTISTSALTRKSNPGTGEDPGFNLVGNPYPSVLDVNKLVFTNITATAYVYQHSGSYIVWSQGTGGDEEVHHIQPGQGFFVEATTDGATLTFTNAAREHHDLGSLDKKSTEVSTNSEVLIIDLQKEGKSDKTYIGFREGATKSFDSYYDAYKLFGNKSNSYIFSYLDKDLNEKMAINAFPTPQEDEVVPLGLKIKEEGDYSLNFSNMDSFEEQPVFFVKDLLLHKVYDLQEDSVISFSYYQGQPEHRFDLYFKDIQEEDDLDDHFVVYVNNNRIYLYSLAEFEPNTSVEIYNVLGQKVYEDVLVNIEDGLEVRWPSSYYIIRLQDANNAYSETFFIP